MLNGCAEQLKDVFCDIFNISLSQASLPTCLKSSIIIISLPKNPSSMNDYHLVSLNSICMTCFERLVISYIRSCLPTNLDPLHFAYSANRSTEDGISTLLHLTLTHMENKNTCARILLMDFSSAFNTILPQQLVERLLLQGLQDSGVCRWIINFLFLNCEHRYATRVCSESFIVHPADI